VDFAVLKNTPTNQSGVAHGEEGKRGVRFALLGHSDGNAVFDKLQRGSAEALGCDAPTGYRIGNVVFNLPLLGRKEFEMRAVEKTVATKNDEEIIIVSRFPRI
jgi:hypothetical protein